jgi:hypothetical protein
MPSPRAFSAVELDFLIPAAIFRHRAVRAFLADLLALEHGATIEHANTGIWKGQAERTQVARLTMPRAKARRFLPAIARRAAALVDELAADLKARQEEFRFVAREVTVYVSAPRRGAVTSRAGASRPSRPGGSRRRASSGRGTGSGAGRG